MDSDTPKKQFSEDFLKAMTDLQISVHDILDFEQKVEDSKTITIENQNEFSKLLKASNDCLHHAQRVAQSQDEKDFFVGYYSETKPKIHKFYDYSSLAWNKTIEALTTSVSSLQDETAKQIQKSKDLQVSLATDQANLLEANKKVESSYSNFLTIGSLLVALVALIFGNVSQLIANDLNVRSLLIINLSLLLSISTIFFFIALINSNTFASDQNQNKKKNNKSFLLVFAFVIVVLAVALVIISCFAGNFSPSASSSALDSGSSSIIQESV